QLVSLSGSKFDDDVYEVTVPTLDGEIGILDHHMPLIAVAKTGVVAVRRQARDTDAQREFFAINGGAIEVENNKLRILVDEADHADEINESEAAAAMERAKKMKAEATDQVSLEHAQALVDRHAVRIQVANLKRRRNKQ
ncbi:ATP synthase F1 subunit epsilon, partial [Polaromonas sp.]|nr:ATP synthase F1 subunit epsilon [Candidatus Saccharibacteria bacterium]